MLAIWNGDGILGGGLEQSCCPWCFLGWGAKKWSRVEVESHKPGAQSGYHAEIVTYDHNHMWAQIWFKIDLNWVWLFPKVLISV